MSKNHSPRQTDYMDNGIAIGAGLGIAYGAVLISS